MTDDNSNWVDPDAVRPKRGDGEEPSDESTTDSTTEDLDAIDPEIRAKAEQLSEAARKIATETGYAFAGFAGLLGEKAKQFYDEQRQQYAQTHPEADKDPGAKEFLQQLADKLNGFVDELARGYKDLAEKGRETFGHADKDTPTTDTDGTSTTTTGGTSPEDLPSAVVTDADLYEEPIADQAPPIIPESRDDL